MSELQFGEQLPLLVRLRTMANVGWNAIGNEAAEEIERLTEQVDVMREALDDLLHQVNTFCETYGEADFETGQATNALATLPAPWEMDPKDVTTKMLDAGWEAFNSSLYPAPYNTLRDVFCAMLKNKARS